MTYLSDIEKINKLAKSLKDTGIAANMEDAVHMAENILRRSKSPEQKHAELMQQMPPEEKKDIVQNEINELAEENEADESEMENSAEEEREYTPEESPSEQIRREETTEDVLREESIVDDAIASPQPPIEEEPEQHPPAQTEYAEENQEPAATTYEKPAEETAGPAQKETQEMPEQDDDEITEDEVPAPSEELMEEYHEAEHPSETKDEPVGSSTIFSEYKAEENHEAAQDAVGQSSEAPVEEQVPEPPEELKDEHAATKDPSSPDYDITQEEKTLAELMAEDAAAIYGTPEQKEDDKTESEEEHAEESSQTTEEPETGEDEISNQEKEDDSEEEAIEEFTREIPVEKKEKRPELTEEQKKQTDLSRIFNYSGGKSQ